MACAVEESGYGKGNFVIVTLTAKTSLKWKCHPFSWQLMEALLTFLNQIVTIGISRRERIRPDASTTAGQGGNAFEHQHSVTCFRGAFVVSSKSKAISLQCWSLFCSQFQSEHPLSWQEPWYASLYTNLPTCHYQIVNILKVNPGWIIPLSVANIMSWHFSLFQTKCNNCDVAWRAPPTKFWLRVVATCSNVNIENCDLFT